MSIRCAAFFFFLSSIFCCCSFSFIFFVHFCRCCYNVSDPSIICQRCKSHLSRSLLDSVRDGFFVMPKFIYIYLFFSIFFYCCCWCSVAIFFLFIQLHLPFIARHRKKRPIQTDSSSDCVSSCSSCSSCYSVIVLYVVTVRNGTLAAY